MCVIFKTRKSLKLLGLLVFLAVWPSLARADATLLLEEPYGKLGFFTGMGHVALYFDRICAETPLLLRPCMKGADMASPRTATPPNLSFRSRKTEANAVAP